MLFVSLPVLFQHIISVKEYLKMFLFFLDNAGIPQILQNVLGQSSYSASEFMHTSDGFLP